MLQLRQELLEKLRVAARQGKQASFMLRALIAELGTEGEERPLWVRYFSEAFCFTNGQGYKIFGWSPNGTGALADAALDSLLAARIKETRVLWDKLDYGAVDLAAPVGKRDN